MLGDGYKRSVRLARLACLALAAALLWLPAAARAERPSKYLLADPAKAHRVDYLVVAGDDYATELDELLQHRAKQNLAVGLVTMSQVTKRFKTLPRFLSYAVLHYKAPAPTYLLLVGDTKAVPAVIRDGAHPSPDDADLATDFDYANPVGAEKPLHVGRFPASNRAQLATMVRKTLDYERRLKGGPWQRRVDFVASASGYGEAFDQMAERQFAMIASEIPSRYEISMTYGLESSAYCPYPPDLNETTVGRLNRGALMFVYVGHGTAYRFERMSWNGQRCPIFEPEDAARVAVREGLPILVAIACSTGRFDKSDYLGKSLLTAPAGPVAFIGGSRVTQPYGNLLLGRALARQVFRSHTVGQALTQAKLDVLEHAASRQTLQADLVAGIVQGQDALEPMRRDVVAHYNLLGDPAMVIRRPAMDIKVTMRGTTAYIDAPGHKSVELELVCDPSQQARELPAVDPASPQFRKQMNARYRAANDKVVRRWTLPLKNGKATLDVPLPANPGRYHLRATDGGSSGSAELVKPAPPKAKAAAAAVVGALLCMSAAVIGARQHPTAG